LQEAWTVSFGVIERNGKALYIYVLKVLELCYCVFLLEQKMLIHTLFFLTQNLSWAIRFKLPC